MMGKNISFGELIISQLTIIWRFISIPFPQFAAHCWDMWVWAFSGRKILQPTSIVGYVAQAEKARTALSRTGLIRNLDLLLVELVDHVMMASKMSKYMLHSLIENGKDGTDSADSWENSAFQFWVSGWLKQKTAGRLSLFPVATVATVATSVIATAESKLEAPCLFAAPEPFISCSSVHLAANSFPHQPLFGLKLCFVWSKSIVVPQIPNIWSTSAPRIQLLFACGPCAGSRSLRPGHHLGGGRLP